MQTIIKVDEMMENIYSLEKALSDKLGYIALAHTRMGKRAQRPGAELVKDAVCNSLRAETEMLRASKEDLVRVLEEVTLDTLVVTTFILYVCFEISTYISLVYMSPYQKGDVFFVSLSSKSPMPKCLLKVTKNMYFVCITFVYT